MKFGLFLLVIGLLIAGAGASAWMMFSPGGHPYYQNDHEARAIFSLGLGAMVIGGGLGLGGIVRIATKK